MPQSKSPATYEDIYETVLYPALSSPSGKRLTFSTPDAAFNMKMRIYAAIAAMRRQNKSAFPPDHPSHGRSDFDSLVIAHTKGECFFDVRPPGLGLDNIKIEDL